MRGDENIGMEIAGSEAEETVEEGSVAVEDETNKEDEEETDEEEKEEEPDRLSELEILPGKTAYINFYYTIDPEIEGMKDQDIKFSFDWTQENKDGKEEKHNKKEEFCYSVDALNLLTVTTGGEKGWIEVGKEDEMLLEFDLGQMREILDEAVEEELEKHEDDDASASEARRASASEILVGWDDENGSRPLGKKDPAMIKKLKCEVETFGLKLNKFKAAPVTDDDNYGTSLKCDFLVSRNNVPGTYYGRVKASYEIKNRTFHTTQAFKVVVKQETGEIELTGKIGNSEIIMSGPASSFPRAEELSLKVSEVTQEQQEKVDEALQKKAEEEGTEIKQYKALDIKLIADGKETEPEGDVQVRFKNVELENSEEKKEAEQEKAEEQSIVKKAVRKVMSLFGVRDDEDEKVEAVAETEAETETKESEEVKEEGSEETTETSENIKVLHLDEDAVVANEITSEVKDNGDVIMDTDHFSVYIIVNVPDGVKDVQLTVNHYATVNKYHYEAVQPNGSFVEVKKEEEGEFYYLDNTKVVLQKPDKKSNEESNAVYIQLAETGRETADGYLKPGSNTAKKEEASPYDTEDVQIYSSDTRTILNGSGTGEDYIFKLDDWSKVSAAKNYEVDYVRVKNDYYANKENIKKITKKHEVIYATINITKEELEKMDESTKINVGTPKEETLEDGTIIEKYPVKIIDYVKFFSQDNPEIQLSKGQNTIDIYYKPLTKLIKSDVEFHDYNVSIGDTPINNNEAQTRKNNTALNAGNDPTFKEDNTNLNIRTNQVGINNPYLWMDEETNQPTIHSLVNDDNDKRIGIGIWCSTSYDKNKNLINTAAIAHRYLQQHVFGAAPVIRGIPDSSLTNGNITFNLETRKDFSITTDTNNNSANRMNNVQVEPGLFYPGDIYTIETYNESGTKKEILQKEVKKDDGTTENVGTYIAKKYLTNYKLGFERTGDTYILSSVYQNNEANPTLSDLNNLKCSSDPTKTTWGKNSPKLYSNLFWPLDGAEYTGYNNERAIKGKTRDYEFGRNFGFGSNDEFDPTCGQIDPSSPTKSHNWYFGMRYDFGFTIGDYIGPMDYYFRGDDDFWLYIDGKLVEDVELGGVHNAKGAYVDLNKWMKENLPSEYDENGKLKDPNKEHSMTVFFMERGGTGSCCYMQFTVPNAYPKGTPKSAVTERTVEKVWVDEPEDIQYHTDIAVVLKQNGEWFGHKVLKAPNWTAKWENLPMYSKKELNEENIYTIEEVTKIPGYDTEITSSGTKFIITNIRNRSIDIPIEKQWENVENDKDHIKPSSIQVQLWKKLLPLNTATNTPPNSNNEVSAGSEIISSNIMEGEKENSVDTMMDEQNSSVDIMESEENSSDNDGTGDAGELADETATDSTDEVSGNPNNETSTGNNKVNYIVPDEKDGWSKVGAPISLTETDEWKGGWTNLAFYEKDTTDGEWKRVIYTISEEADCLNPTKYPNGWYVADYVVNDTGGFTITNTFTDSFSVNIPITKQCIDLGSAESKEFEFEVRKIDDITIVTEGNKNNVESYQTSELPINTTSIIVKGDEEKTNMVNLEYNNSEFAKIINAEHPSVSRYYEIKEKPGSGNFIYDLSTFIIEVVISKDEQGKFIATPGRIWKDKTLLDPNSNSNPDSEAGKDEYIKFKNRKIVKLEITKDVSTGGNKDFEFSFIAEITLPNELQSFILPGSSDSNQWYGTQDTLKDFTSTATKENGVIEVSFNLKHGNTVIIPVPIGSKVIIRETSHAGYDVKFSVNGIETKGDTIEIPDNEFDGTVANINVICTNKPGVVLPDTGGPGLLMMSRLGWMLLLLALLMAGMEIQFYGERRNRKTATVQREDTRGFDPDDY